MTEPTDAQTDPSAVADTAAPAAGSAAAAAANGNSDVWTIGRLLRWTTDFLKQKGCLSPRLDAEVLLAAARDCERIALYTAFEEPASDELRTAFRELVKRRAAGEPVAYLVGKREFYSLSFRVNRHVLIPRPETEFLVLAALDAARELRSTEAVRVLDVGTGSGAVAVSIAKQLPAARVVAVDLSDEALAVAAENVTIHNVAERVELRRSDLLAGLRADERFDIVVSNPPYVSTAEFDQLAPEVRDYEPRLALVAGPSGTEVIDALIDQAAKVLAAGGCLFLEVSPMIYPTVTRRLQADQRYTQIGGRKDLAGLFRIVSARRAACEHG